MSKTLKIIIIVVISALIVGAIIYSGYLDGLSYKKESNKEKTESKIINDNSGSKEKNLNSNDPIVKKAFNLINLKYEGLVVMDQIYSGNDIDFTKLSDSIKFNWTLNILDNEIDIPMCDGDNTSSIEESTIKKYSVFEDTSFIDNVKTSSDIIGTYNYSFDNGSFIVSNGNCDGYGPGPSPITLKEVDHATQNDNILTLYINFAYYTPKDYDDERDEFTYTARATLNNDGEVLKDDVTSVENITDDHSEFVVTFKINGDNIYPLTVKKI